MGKGGDGVDSRYRPPLPRDGRAQVPPPPRDRRPEGYRVSQVRRSEKFGGNATKAAVDGLQFPPDSSPSQSQQPAGSSVGVEAGQDTELAAKSGLPTPYSVVPDEVPKISGQATERATSGVPNPDSEGLGGRNEASEEALVVQLHGALHGLEELDRAARVFHGVARNSIALLLRCVRSLEYNLLRPKLCECSLPNGEKAGKSSDAPCAKRKELWVSKDFPGVRPRGHSFGSEIRLPGMKNKFWLGSFKTAEAAGQAFQVAADWREAHRDSKSFSKEELDDLKKRAQKAGEHLSDDRSHHNDASPDLAATSASSKGKAVASPERKSPAREKFSSELDLDLDLSDWDNSFSELNMTLWDDVFRSEDNL